jgi:hypothetical protein
MKTTGMGMSTTATQPRRVPAQLTPREANMYFEKRGKTAPARERRNVFAAMAEAALCGLLVFPDICTDEYLSTYNMR